MDIEKIIAAARAAEDGASGQEVPQQSATGQEQGASVEVSADNSDKVSKGRKKSERVQNNELEGSAVQSQDISFNNSAPLGYKADGTPRKRKPGGGRKNKGLTKEHYEQKKRDFLAIKHAPNSDNFPIEIIERVNGDIIADDDIEQFAELYKLTCYSVYDDYMNEHPELNKLHPYQYYKRIILKIKEHTPKVSWQEVDKLLVVWDILNDFMQYIGLYITYEIYQYLLNIYDYQLKKGIGLSPKYNELLQKINIERDAALLNELNYNPYAQPNKMFVAKTHGIIEQQQPRQVEVVHSVQHFDSISRYRLAESD